MKYYPEAEYDFLPDNFNADGSMEVRVVIKIGEHSRFMWLPVMDFSNKATTKPDGMAINKARMRCLVKCIAMFGLGLYIYAGEDLPDSEDDAPKITAPQKPWYNDFEKQKKWFEEQVNGGASCLMLIEKLEEKYLVSKEVKTKILELGK